MDLPNELACCPNSNLSLRWQEGLDRIEFAEFELPMVVN